MYPLYLLIQIDINIDGGDKAHASAHSSSPQEQRARPKTECAKTTRTEKTQNKNL
jgi:hypothetical protein